MKQREIRRFRMFALLGVLLALCAAAWLRKSPQPPATVAGTAIETAADENVAITSPQEKRFSARAGKVVPRFSRLDAVESAAAGSAGPARAEEFENLQPAEAHAQAGAAVAMADARHAFERALELPDDPERNELLQRIATTWLQNDPVAALEWVSNTVNETGKRIVVRQHLSNLLASNDPAAAAAWLDRLSEPIERNAMASRLSETWGRLESHAAWQWAIALNTGETRSIAIQNVLASWAEGHPVEAATTAVTELPSQEQSDGVLAVLLSWTRRDPAAAASWVSLFPESPLRETATQNVVGNWALRDVESARQWLEDLPSSASRDAGFLTWQSMAASSTSPGN